jgi:hypothetical protein
MTKIESPPTGKSAFGIHDYLFLKFLFKRSPEQFRMYVIHGLLEDELSQDDAIFETNALVLTLEGIKLKHEAMSHLSQNTATKIQKIKIYQKWIK